jgi:hypothetical protein
MTTVHARGALGPGMLSVGPTHRWIGPRPSKAGPNAPRARAVVVRTVRRVHFAP